MLERTCAVKVRSTRPPAPARLTHIAPTETHVEILGGEDAVAPGQACVFYETEGTRVLGGGWITAAQSAAAA